MGVHSAHVSHTDKADCEVLHVRRHGHRAGRHVPQAASFRAIWSTLEKCKIETRQVTANNAADSVTSALPVLGGKRALFPGSHLRDLSLCCIQKKEKMNEKSSELERKK